MNDEARKIAQDIVIPWDENFHGRLALVDSIAAALVAAEERGRQLGIDQCRSAVRTMVTAAESAARGEGKQ